MKLRPYQQEIVDYCEGALAFGSTRIAIDAQTGAGKSVIIAELCRIRSSDKIVISVNISKLVMQLSSHLDAMGIKHSILKSGMDERYDENERVQIWMDQTFDKRAAKINFKADLVIKDELHIGVSGERFKKLIAKVQPSAIVGTSATPYDGFGVALKDYELCSFTDIKSLTDSGFLMPADTIICKAGQSIDLDAIKTSGDYSDSELDDLLGNDEYRQSVVEAYMEHASGKKAIVFVSGISQCDELARVFSENGVSVGSVHSKQTAKSNELMMDAFEGKSMDDISVLVSMGKLTTGWDFPDCNVIINCRPTKIRSLYTQMIGRVLRTTKESSDRALILDMCRSTTDHGLYNEPFIVYATKKEAKEETYRCRENVIDYMDSVYPHDFIVEREILDKEHIFAGEATSQKARLWRFRYARTHLELIVAASELYESFYNQEHKMSKVKWIMEGITPTISWMSVGALRSRLTKMLKEGKKFGGIRNYPTWFRDNVLGGQSWKS